MKILYISLTDQGNDYAYLRYFWDNLNDYKEHRLPIAEIKKLSNKAETDYYTYLPVEDEKTGQALYNWLDKSDRVLANALQEPHQEGLIIAIATDWGLAHLPWELLHDGECFLVVDEALEAELRQVKNKLSADNLCCQLEDYLQQEKWREADEETAWLFYLVMILRGYKNWGELFEKFPSHTLNEIDRLWVKYSEGHFGFSVQKHIWESVGGSTDYDTWINFRPLVGLRGGVCFRYLETFWETGRMGYIG